MRKLPFLAIVCCLLGTISANNSVPAILRRMLDAPKQLLIKIGELSHGHGPMYDGPLFQEDQRMIRRQELRERAIEMKKIQ